VKENSHQLVDYLNQAAAHLLEGGLVAFPTETVYGLGANAQSQAGVKRIYQAKNRPSDRPLIVHIAHPDDVSHFATNVPEFARSLMRDFWPGPMTLILNRTENAKDFVTGSQETVGLRIPNHPVPLALLSAHKSLGGVGIAAPSANRYGSVSPTSASAVAAELGEFLTQDDFILDGGDSEVGLESTIIDCTGEAPRILRPGAITSEMIEESTKLKLRAAEDNQIRVSGSHKKHYSPRAKVIIDGASKPGEGLIAMADHPTPEGVVRLAAPNTNEEYAHELYQAMRAADEQGLNVINILLPNADGIALAIIDRIQRAASK
jgi:L-threonylcarbamoyladenylate synthase